MKTIDKWGQAAVAVGLHPEVSADDPGVLLLFVPGSQIMETTTRKVGLIVIRAEAVTYAELDGRVFDTITSDQRPLHVQLGQALRERGR